MISERCALEFLRGMPELLEYCGGQVYYGEAPQGITEPYVILYPVTAGRVGEAGAHFPMVQISCFETDQFKVLDLADLVVRLTDGYRGAVGQAYTDSCHSVRVRPLRNADGTWMCPVEMKFSYLEG